MLVIWGAWVINMKWADWKSIDQAWFKIQFILFIMYVIRCINCIEVNHLLTTSIIGLLQIISDYLSKSRLNDFHKLTFPFASAFWHTSFYGSHVTLAPLPYGSSLVYYKTKCKTLLMAPSHALQLFACTLFNRGLVTPHVLSPFFLQKHGPL